MLSSFWRGGENTMKNIVAIHTNGTYTPNEAGATNSGRRMNASLCAWLQDNGYLN